MQSCGTTVEIMHSTCLEEIPTTEHVIKLRVVDVSNLSSGNDLWQFDIRDSRWSWLKGSNTTNATSTQVPLRWLLMQN
jgi:hypothetical protein